MKSFLKKNCDTFIFRGQQNIIIKKKGEHLGKEEKEKESKEEEKEEEVIDDSLIFDFSLYSFHSYFTFFDRLATPIYHDIKTEKLI